MTQCVTWRRDQEDLWLKTLQGNRAKTKPGCIRLVVKMPVFVLLPLPGQVTDSQPAVMLSCSLELSLKHMHRCPGEIRYAAGMIKVHMGQDDMFNRMGINSIGS